VQKNEILNKIGTYDVKELDGCKEGIETRTIRIIFSMFLNFVVYQRENPARNHVPYNSHAMFLITRTQSSFSHFIFSIALHSYLIAITRVAIFIPVSFSSADFVKGLLTYF
jgi:hypothetical protein